MKHVKTKMLGLLAVVLLVGIGGCKKQFACVNREVCVLYYKGLDTNITCRSWQSDTSKMGSQSTMVVEYGYDYEFIYDSTFYYTVTVSQTRYKAASYYFDECAPL